MNIRVNNEAVAIVLASYLVFGVSTIGIYQLSSYRLLMPMAC
ncbi:hypothetical protein swp_4589 [Shewanella piezotolerans WP3]|uniref:Uncharacterized protein n=1 Tax=Shewanella piezotolerans (strain WP3 / JCM 13877) TaxID=225849 RepID=B8CUN7_SHEPW|nr:hypothetical protein swp_4589 [Shewanella piezotolerans WP3]